MKLENNWKYKTLENLEKSFWGEPEFHSNLVITCHKLRKKQLIHFTIEDLRIMIGQNFSLKYLIPLAIDKLKVDILVEGDLFVGDLLEMVLNSDAEYWKKENYNWKIVCELFKENIDRIEDFGYQNNCKNQWLIDFEKFKKIN